MQHVDHIRREGNFAEVNDWQENNQFVGNFISSADNKDACNGLVYLLYKTDYFGSNEFIRRVLDTAIFENLPVSFADKKIQTEFRRQKEKKEIERRNFIANGGKIFTERSNFLLQLLKQENSKMLPKEDFACPHCPNSLWFIQNQKELTCYCKMMNLVSWTPSQKTYIQMCDGIFLNIS